jgi:SulP family sulfate permease
VTFPEQWLPRSVTSLRTYSVRRFTHDLASGLTVGLVALPLAMAFGIASGVTPQAGLYTAVVAGFLISALGGSRVQIGGPTGAFVVIVAGIVARFGPAGLSLVTLMAGAMLLIMGLTGLGSAVKFIPRPVIIGFTNGIALLIASTQIKDFLGLRTGAVPSSFLPRMKTLAENVWTLQWPTVAVACATLAIILLWPRVNRRIPGSILAVLGCTAVSALFHLHVETIGTRFGGIPQGFPPFTMPHLHAEHILPLLPSAFTVALLCAIESLLSAVVADSMAGDRHNSNVELVAQGIANIASPLFGGIPATGAIARTATNIRSGALTPVSGIVHALTLLGILLVAAPLARFIPLATLAAVLFVVAWNMGEWREIGGVLRMTRADIAVWLVTFTLTVIADLTVAVGVGMALAALLYIYRIAETTTVELVTEKYLREGQAHILQDKEIPSQRRHPPHPRTLPLRSHAKAGRRHSGPEGIPCHRDPAPPEYDGPRCDRPLCARSLCGAAPRIRPNSPALRRSRSTRRTALPNRLRRGNRPREHSPQCPGRPHARPCGQHPPQRNRPGSRSRHAGHEDLTALQPKTPAQSNEGFTFSVRQCILAPEDSSQAPLRPAFVEAIFLSPVPCCAAAPRPEQ